jgi:hypothetical protein
VFIYESLLIIILVISTQFKLRVKLLAMEGSNNNATKAQEEKKAVVPQSNGVEAPATK